MTESLLRFIRRSAEFLKKEKINDLPPRLRGIYVLYGSGNGKNVYDVRYIGMATKGGIKGRLRSHRKSKRKEDEWTHFSVFEVWSNVTNREISELEGLARHIYRFDATASTLNIQRGYQALRRVRDNKIKSWER